MIKNAKDLRGKSLPDYLEKKLIIARYFINQKNANKEFGEKEVYYMWNNYFPSDFRISPKRKLKLKEGKYYGQLVLLENASGIPEDLIKSYSNKWKNYYCWIIKYVRTHTLKECDRDIAELRKEHHKMLIHTFKPLQYYVKDATEKVSAPRLATYHIFKKGNMMTGSYEKLIEYAAKIE